MLHGRRLINLDSEEEGALCVGCAGGADSRIALPVTAVDVPPGAEGIRVRLHGLKGGHSGVDIHLQRGNAIQLLARALYAARVEGDFQVAAFEGGNAHNAIPREATATLLVSEGEAAVRERVEQELSAIRDEFEPVEPGLAWQIQSTTIETALDDGSSRRLIELLVALPHGVLAMSYDIPGLVETSTNLATVGVAHGAASIHMSSRSSVGSALASVRRRIRAASEMAGGSVEEGGGYPGWKPDMDSELLRVVGTVHQRELGSAPEVGAIHAGLECGLIGEMVPGMDMISFGPQIEFPHSPDERVKVDSVDRFWKLLTAVLEELAA
jgi:dipeptidase D